MSLKKIEQVKKDKFFRLWDILLYGIIALIIVALFLAVLFTSDNSALKGIDVWYNNNLACSYSFESGELTINLPENIKVESSDENSLTLIFCTDEGSLEKPSDYNIIFIDIEERSVKVTETDCSNRKDCVHTSAMTTSSDSIVCAPHKLRILPSEYSDFSDYDGDDNLPID